MLTMFFEFKALQIELFFYFFLEIGGQIDDCITQAEAEGLDTTKLFFGGHR